MERKQLVQWLDDVQTRIGKVLINEKIAARVTRVMQSPLVVTFQLELDNPQKINVDKAKMLGETLEQHIGISPIRIYPQAGKFVVEIPSPNPVSPHGDMFLDHVTPSTVCLGYDTSVEPVLLNMQRFPSLMLVAPPRAGKTSCARSIAYSLLKSQNVTEEKVTFMICAEKLEYWRAFIDKRGVVGVYSSFDDMEQMVETVSRQLSLKARHGDRFDPPLYIIVDDLLRVLAQTEKLGEYLAEIASTGGSVGVYLILITQAAGLRDGTGGIKVEDNIAARVIYRTTSKMSAARGTGSDASGVDDLTTTPGDALLVVGSIKQRIATGYVGDEDIVQLVDAGDAPSKFLQNLRLYTPVVQEPETVEVQLAIAQPTQSHSLTLPKISPPRELNLAEVRHLAEVVKHYNNINQPLSKNRMLKDIFGGKNGTYQRFLEDALRKVNEIQTVHA